MDFAGVQNTNRRDLWNAKHVLVTHKCPDWRVLEFFFCQASELEKQAGAELGQAQVKLEVIV